MSVLLSSVNLHDDGVSPAFIGANPGDFTAEGMRSVATRIDFAESAFKLARDARSRGVADHVVAAASRG